MPLHRQLSRQLKLTSHLDKKLCQSDDIDQIVSELINSSDPETVLKELLGKVSESYHRFDRDIKLRTTSLQNSYLELEQANETLRSEADFQNELISTLEDNIESLLRSSGRSIRDKTLEAKQLPEVFAELLQENQAAKRHLEFQKYALDEHAIVSICDLDGRITYANEKLCELSGFTQEELIGQTHDLVKSEQHDEAFFTDLISTVWTGKVWHGEMQSRSKEGKLYWVDASVTPILGEEGKPEQYISICTDITQRKEMEQALDKERQFLDRLANTMGEGVYALDTQGCCIFVNDEAEKILGWSKQELLGQRIHDLLHNRTPEGKHLPAAECPIMLANSDNQIFRSENELFIHKNGEGIPIEVTSVPLILNGERAGSVAAFKDISQRKQDELTRQLALERAESATRAKSEFLANMSHEIRTPMNAIIGLSHLALEGELSRQQRNYVDKIHGSAKNLLNIINDILDFSKIEAGQMQIEKVAFEIDQLLRNVYDVNLIKAQEKGIELSVKRDFSLPGRLMGDPVRLNQILTNLVSNAIKFTEQGAVTVNLYPAIAVDGQSLVRVEVKDTGVGIEEAQQKQLFEAFTQADASTTRKYGGTGLGLSITRQLTELVGGSIDLQSVVGEGTRIWVDLPLESAADTVPAVKGHHLSDKQLVVIGVDTGLSHLLQSLDLSFRVLPVDPDGYYTELETLVAEARIDCLIYIDHQPEYTDLSDTGVLDTIASLRQNFSGMDQLPVVLVSESRSTLLSASSDVDKSLFLLSDLNTPSSLLDTLQEALGSGAETDNQLVPETRWQGQISILGAKVLLAEDNPINTEVAKGMLEKMGVRTTCVENGKLALQALEQSDFDIVLMDLQMPVMDGYTAAEKIRSQSRYDDLPVVALTAHAMSGDKERSLALGMNDHITKPINPEELQQTLVKWVGARAGEEQTKSVQTQEVDIQDVDIPDKLPGLECGVALSRVSLDFSFYLSLWKQFEKQYADLPEQVSELLQQADLDELNAFGHGLKGVCANLGATALSRVGADIEKLDTIPDEHEEILDPVRRELKVLLNSVNQLRELAQEDESGPETSLRPLPVIVEELKPLLDTGDTGALVLLEELEGYQTQAGLDTGLRSAVCRLTTAIADFDFEEAAQVIQDMELGAEEL